MAHPMKSACSSDSSRVRKIAGYRKGGAVHKTDGKADKKMFAKKFEPKLKAEGDKPKARLDKFARGGKVKGKSATTVNVIVAPKGAGDQAAMPPPDMGPAMPPPPSPPTPPAGAGGPPPGMPMRKNGGAAYAKGGKVGSTFKESVKNGTPVMHDDAKSEEQKHFTNKPPITRKRGGSVKMDDGAGGGLGRLEKVKMQKRA
jgi:hypothetical protein